MLMSGREELSNVMDIEYTYESSRHRFITIHYYGMEIATPTTELAGVNPPRVPLVGR